MTIDVHILLGDHVVRVFQHASEIQNGRDEAFRSVFGFGFLVFLRVRGPIAIAIAIRAPTGTRVGSASLLIPPLNPLGKQPELGSVSKAPPTLLAGTPPLAFLFGATDLVLALGQAAAAALGFSGVFFTFVNTLGRGGLRPPDGDEPRPFAKVVPGRLRGRLAEGWGVEIVRATIRVSEWREAWRDFSELFDERELKGMFRGFMLGFGCLELSNENRCQSLTQSGLETGATNLFLPFGGVETRTASLLFIHELHSNGAPMLLLFLHSPKICTAYFRRLLLPSINFLSSVVGFKYVIDQEEYDGNKGGRINIAFLLVEDGSEVGNM